MSEFDKIIELAKQNHNIIKTSMVVEAGIRKEKLKLWVEEKRIKRIGRGLYALSDSFIDRYFEFQVKCPKAVYSYNTSAYLCGLLEHPLDKMECTLPRGFNTSHIKSRFEVQYHFVTEEQYELGLVEIDSPFGSKIMAYDRERVVCDYIRHKARCDIQIWGSVLNGYFRSRNKDIKKLIRYAKFFNIMDELEMYVELLQ